MRVIATAQFVKLCYPHMGTQPGFGTPSKSPGMAHELFAPVSDSTSSKDIEMIWGLGRKKRKKKKKRKVVEEMPDQSY